MTKINYSEQAKILVKVVEIAIESIRQYPPEGFSVNHIDQFVNTYLDFRNKIENPEPQFHNMKSLKHLQNDMFIYFQEGKGKAVNHFWRQLRYNQLNFKRENKLIKILKRQKINNIKEYDFVIDVFVPYQEEGILNEEDVRVLNKLISSFENKKGN